MLNLLKYIKNIYSFKYKIFLKYNNNNNDQKSVNSFANSLLLSYKTEISKIFAVLLLN